MGTTFLRTVAIAVLLGMVALVTVSAQPANAVATAGSTIEGLPPSLGNVIASTPAFQAERSRVWNAYPDVVPAADGLTLVVFDLLPTNAKGPVALHDALIFVTENNKVVASYLLEPSLDGNARLVDTETGTVAKTTRVRLPSRCSQQLCDP